MRMKIKVTSFNRKPYIVDVNEKIGKIYLAKNNPNIKYELVNEEPKQKQNTEVKVEQKSELDKKIADIKKENK